MPSRSIPYTKEALQQDLRRVRIAWEECQADRDRDAIYKYLAEVFGLVAWWDTEGEAVSRARWALRLARAEHSSAGEPFGAIISCTSDPDKVDKRTKSKWSRALRYAAEFKLYAEPLDQFMRRKGGINRCASRFTQHLGRP